MAIVEEHKVDILAIMEPKIKKFGNNSLGNVLEMTGRYFNGKDGGKIFLPIDVIASNKQCSNVKILHNSQLSYGSFVYAK